ncbi:unnamed protein product [Nippostrongylus brasiliensis]|uniref:Endo/exonuclease/phosphatase domain-containing protein n=1 Tax=Nippostrongylus brasiliensis TaxID=27835 RepID=A0A0N4YZ19_NIPBR|nr:unnamed protein product [Nippostrongylus brasiliensis]
MSVRIDTKEGCWTIISVYAPQTGCSDKEKGEFYEALDDVIRSVPEEDFLTIAGDLNGQVGADRREVERVHGGRVGSRNEDGERNLDLAVAHDLAICSTFFAKRESQKMTYCSGGRKTEVDHIFVHVVTQHRPLVADLNVVLPPKVKVRTEPRIRWWKLKGPEQSELKRRVVAAGLPNPDGPVNEIWRLATRTILQCAKDVLGETKGGQKGDRAAWFWNDEVQKAVSEKKEAFKTWQTSRLLEDLAKYKNYKRRAKIASKKELETELLTKSEREDQAWSDLRRPHPSQTADQW